MKLSSIFKSAIVAVAAVIGMSSCSDDGYWTAYEPDGPQYSFLRSEIQKDFVLSTEYTELPFTFSIRRGDASGQVTLKFEVEESTKNAFKYIEVPDEVTFEPGVYEATIEGMFKRNTKNKATKVKVSFPEEFKSPGGNNAVTLNFKWVEPPKDK